VPCSSFYTNCNAVARLSRIAKRRASSSPIQWSLRPTAFRAAGLRTVVGYRPDCIAMEGKRGAVSHRTPEGGKRIGKSWGVKRHRPSRRGSRAGAMGVAGGY
jgi:hypothetical protein